MRARLAGLVLSAGLVPLALGAPPGNPRGTPEALSALEAQVKGALDRAESSVVALVVSQNPRHLAVAPGAPQPLSLGDYPAPPPPEFGRRGAPRPVVNYDARLDLADPRNAADYAIGSGVVLDAGGLILTNYHLIDGARKIYARAAGGAGSYADIHAADARSDLAVLRLRQPVPGLAPITLFDGRTAAGPRGEPANLVRGMLVLTLGHPSAAGAADGTPAASWGTLSGTRRRGPVNLAPTEEQKLKPLHQFGVLLQTDARITLGCSGAALLNLDGQLIGLGTPTVAVMGADTAGGYALPMDPNYRRIVSVLRAGREVEYGMLGARLGALPRLGFGGAPGAGGVAVVEVMPGGPASEAGLVGDPRGGGGDLITAVDGAPVRDFDDLFPAVNAALAGTTVQLDVARNGATRRVPVTLGKFVHALPWLASERPRAMRGITADYATVAQQKLGLLTVPAGVYVAELEPGSPAATALAELAKSLHPGEPEAARGWAVTRVNGRPVSTPREFHDAGAAAGAGALELTVTELSGRGGDSTVRVPAE